MKLFFLLWSGYNYSYPFLGVDSGIHVEDDFVQPLYKEVINIHHPTMAFIGVEKYVILFRLYDLQVMRIFQQEFQTKS